MDTTDYLLHAVYHKNFQRGLVVNTRHYNFAAEEFQCRKPADIHIAYRQGKLKRDGYLQANNVMYARPPCSLTDSTR